MKKYLLSISLLIIVLSVLFTLMNCGGDNSTTPVAPCVTPKAPTVKLSIKVHIGDSILLTATSTGTKPSFKWTGPNSFISTEQNPTISNATEAMVGYYKCTVTIAGCTSLPDSTAVVIDTTIVVIPGTTTDSRDLRVYKTVKIGNQTWMAQNLNWQPSSQYADYKIYGDNPAYGPVYGVLYDWIIAQKANEGFTGWRLPTDNDWQKLVGYLGGVEVAGAKLKETGTTHWTIPNAGSSNRSGFTAIGAGFFDKSVTMSFLDLKDRTYFWTQTPYNANMVIMILRSDDMLTHSEYGDKTNYYSVRLIKN